MKYLAFLQGLLLLGACSWNVYMACAIEYNLGIYSSNVSQRIIGYSMLYDMGIVYIKLVFRHVSFE